MKTGIIYISKHGTTEKAARIIAEKLNSNTTELINLRNSKIKDVEAFDRIIIGGSIHMASIHKKTRNFCEINKSILLKKPLGLFLCCMEQDEKANEQFENAFSEEIRNHACSKAIVGYEYNLDRMNFFERLLVKKISGSSESISKIDYSEISKFVTEYTGDYS